MKNKRIIFILLLTIILVTITIFLSFYIFTSYAAKSSFENDILAFADKNQNKIFSIDKCLFFSSCDSKNKNTSASNYTLENLYQYTDMAFFINNNSNENTLENTLKSVSISNIKYNISPELGEPSLYFKSINDFSKSDIIDTNKIEENTYNFLITSEDETDLNMPYLYNNCANPITLSFVNQNIKTDYTLTDTSSPITYDGSLLKRCNILLDSVQSSFSFNINITNNLDQEFITTVYVTIPLEDENTSIYDGKFVSENNTSFVFYRYQ